MKNQVYLFVFAITLLLISCEKQTTEPEISLLPKDAPALISKTVDIEVNENFSYELTRNYYYDQENRVVKILQDFKTYRGGELNREDQDTINYYYDIQNRLIQIIQTGENNASKRDYSYNNNMILLDEFYWNGVEYARLNLKSTYTTNVDGQIIKQEDYYLDFFSLEWKEPQSYNSFEWQNGNLINRKGFQKTDLKRGIIKDDKFDLFHGHKIPNYKSLNDSVNYEQTYTYNNNINPFAYLSSGIGFETKNLITSWQTVASSNNTISYETYSYEYGANGFPAKRIAFYEYKSLNEGKETLIYNATTTTEYEYIDLK